MVFWRMQIKKLSKKRFHKINVEISNICNLQCSFCPEVERTKALIDLTLFEKIIEQVAPLTELVCLHLMGEPLVHPALGQMVDICEKHQVKIFLVSNGLLLKPEHHELLTRSAFYQVNFSLHSFFDNYPGKDSQIYLKKIFAWTDQALKIRPDLYINFRLWNLQDIRGSLTENQIMLDEIKEHYAFSFDPTTLNIKHNKSIPIRNRLYLHFDTEFVWPGLNLPVLGSQGSCYGLSSHIGILVDGTVVPCCLDKEGVIELGKIQNNSLEEILASPRAVKILNGFKNKKLEESLCQRCQYIERFQ